MDDRVASTLAGRADAARRFGPPLGRQLGQAEDDNRQRDPAGEQPGSSSAVHNGSFLVGCEIWSAAIHRRFCLCFFAFSFSGEKKRR
jgi:hypothetical protein